MSTRVSSIERIRADIDDLFTSDRELGDILEDVARLGVRLLMQTALEAEVTEFLGRERYARGDRSRDGYCPTTVKTTAGPITIDRPTLRDTDEQFPSRLLGVGVCTNALESLVIAGFIRGLSVRDVEASLADALGSEAALSKSTVSRICEPGQEAVDQVRRQISSFESRYARLYPAAVRCLMSDVESLAVYLRFPKEHWTRICHSNFIERTFGETRRRVKVIGRLPGERSCLSLVWAVLD